ncbi:TrmH family RNA methyltransferase [Actinomycetota bacterium]
MLTNPRSDRVKAVRGLARRSARERSGRFLVEGPQGVREAVRHAPADVVDVYVTPDAAVRYPEIVKPALAAGLFVHEVSDEVLAAMGDSQHPQGVIAVCRVPAPDLPALVERDVRLVLVLTNVRDPGNAGTAIRGADAAGADLVVMAGECVDPLSPKVVRSTAGSTFHVPVVSGISIEDALTALRDKGVRLLAADGVGSLLLPDADLAPAHAWVMGNEAWGLEPEIRDLCDEVVRVPIYGLAESLNLAMASTVCLYASAAAQRR